MREGNPCNKNICMYPFIYGGRHEKVVTIVRFIFTVFAYYLGIDLFPNRIAASAGINRPAG